MKPLLSGYAKDQRRRAISSFLRGDVLDVGCGWTSLPDILTQGQSYVGIDANPRAVDACSQRYRQCTFYLRNLDVEPLGLGDLRFDTVVMAAVLEHLRYPERVLREARTLIRSGGLLAVTTPSPLGELTHRIGSRLGLFYPESSVQHVQVWGRHGLADMSSRCGYQVIQYRHFLFGTNQLLVCQPI
jgi:2-polyprenyl-3-methyl-5-hydroxy-6-metoxy-1,4-benzoquinol methylase